MKLTKIQNRFINNKSRGFSLMKGKSLTGKSLTAIYRVMNLENNYCLYEEDKVLYLSSNNNSLEKVKEIYNNENKNCEFYSLFSMEKERVYFSTVKELIKKYSDDYKSKKKLNYKLLSYNNSFELFKSDCIFEYLSLFRNKTKLLKNISLEDLYEEIMWIKASNFTKEEYKVVDRTRRKNRILKNSISREYIYYLKEVYTSYLWDNGYCDLYDDTNFAIEYNKSSKETYTHIILDESEALTKAEIDFVKSIYSYRENSTFTFIVNNEAENYKNSWLIKGRKFNTLGEDFKGRSYYLKTVFENKIEKNNNFMEKFQYINLKHRNTIDFNIDTSSNKKELYLEDNTIYEENELAEVNVFNDIAAGNPIEMKEEVEDKFYLPKGWLERGKDTFILHVKGDSMIDKNINDGDLVVIKKQYTAYNNDIVAASLDGEATLKILKLNGKKSMLLPANKKYREIPLEGREVFIIGVAIGVIKNRVN